MIKASIREYYILTALISCAKGIATATYVTFLLRNGLNLFEVNLVNFVYFTTLFIAEMPTGAFADVFGRKKSFIASCALTALGGVVYGMSHTFVGFIIAEMIEAVALTFATGAFKAWFVDRLLHHGYTGSLSPVFSRATQIRQASTILAGIVGAYIANVSMPLTWFVGSGLAIIPGIVACFLKEEYFTPQVFSWKNGYGAMKQTMRSSVEYGLKNQNIKFILVMVSIQILAFQAPNMQWQPFFGQHFTGTTALGYIWAGIMLGLIAGAQVAPYLLRRIVDERKALYICQIIAGVTFVAAAVSGTLVGSLVLFFIYEAARGAFDPIKDAYLHDNIPSKERATIDSFESLAHHGGGAIGLLVSGALALWLGIPWTWSILGGFLILATIMVSRRK